MKDARSDLGHLHPTGGQGGPVKELLPLNDNRVGLQNDIIDSPWHAEEGRTEHLTELSSLHSEEGKIADHPSAPSVCSCLRPKVNWQLSPHYM